MSLFLKNIFKKHTNVWKNNIFSTKRFVYQNTDNNTLPEDEGIIPPNEPRESKDNAKEQKDQIEQRKKQEDSRKQFEINTSKIVDMVRRTASQALGAKVKEKAAKSFLESDEFINEITKLIKEKYLHQIQSVKKSLEDAQGELDMRMSYADAMKQIGMIFGIPSTVQKAIMSEFETGTEVKNHVKNFEKFLEKIMNAFSENIKQFINFDQLIAENPNLFNPKAERDEKAQLPSGRIAQRIEKALKGKEKDDTIAFEEKLQETIKTVIEPIVDKACETFGVEEDEMIRKGFKKNSVQRTYLLTEYGNYKEADWYLQTSTNASQEEKEGLEKRKLEAKENIQTQKQRAKIQAAIQIYDLNHADLGGGQSLGERLTKNQDLIENSTAEIKKAERIIEDNEKIIKSSRNETDKTKARNEIISMKNKIELEKKEIELLRSEIDWTLGEYKAEDQNKDDAEKTKRKEEIMTKTREQATAYLINTAGWLNEERYGENAMFGKEDIPILEKILRGEKDETTGKDYSEAISTNQLLTFCEMHKKGKDSFDEFINIVKNCGEVIKELTEKNLERDSFYANFLRDKLGGELPSDANAISSEQLRSFFDGLFGLSESQSEDEGKKAKMKDLKNIVLGYMGGDPKKENKLYYRPDEMNEFGKKKTGVTMGQKGREMMHEMLSAFANNKFNAAADIEKIISTNWNEGLYPCILKYDENARKIEGKHSKEKGQKSDGKEGGTGFWDSPFEKVFGQWRLLNFYMVAEMFTTGFEGVKRNFQLKNARKAAEAGYDLADYIPGFSKILKAEFLSVKQAKENEEVNKYKSSFEQYGYVDIVEQIHNAPNSFVIKAALITLAGKGYLARNDIMDPRSIRAINKHLGAQLGIKIKVPDGDPNDWPSEEKTKIINQLRTVIDPFWGQGTLDGWFSQSDSTRENNVQKNFAISQKLTGAEKERNFSELISLLLKDPDEFKRRYPIDVVLGYIRQDILEGKIDCDYHLTVLSILVWKGILEDNHVEEFRMKHANDYPSYVILNKGQMRHSGLGEFCNRAIQSGDLLKNGLLNDNHWYMKFFINRHKLPLKVTEADPDGEGTYWKIAETAEEALSPQYKVRDVLASNLHKRAAHLQNVDNSNAQVYYRAYDVEELKSNVLRIGTNGKLEKITRGHDLTAALAGFFSSMYSDLDAVRNAAEGGGEFGEGTYENFMTQAKTAFFDLKNTYTLIEHITQHETRMVPKEDSIYGIPKPGEPEAKERSYVRDNANLYYQNIKGARVNRLVTPPVLGVANDFAKNNNFNGEQIKRAIGNMMGLDYMKFNTADKKMLGFKPWEHFWDAAGKFDAYFEHLASKKGWKYNPDEAKSFIKGSAKPKEKGEKLAV